MKHIGPSNVTRVTKETTDEVWCNTQKKMVRDSKSEEARRLMQEYTQTKAGEAAAAKYAGYGDFSCEYYDGDLDRDEPYGECHDHDGFDD